MKYILTLLLLSLLNACVGQRKAHPMPNMGIKYVHFWKHIDSIKKVIFDSAGNYKKEWQKDGDTVFARAAALDDFDDSVYRNKYHFSDYYYMWNYTTQTCEGWGENTVTLDHKPTETEIKNYVWNTEFKGERGKKYYALEIVDIEAKSSNPNTLENLSPSQKGQLNFQKATYKLLQ